MNQLGHHLDLPLCKTHCSAMKALHNAGFVKLIFVFISALSIVYFVAFYAPSRLSTEFDDSYMYCRYASNFLAGNGFSWNAPDGVAYGATSPAYLFLITISKGLFNAGNAFLLSLVSFSAGLLGLAALVYAGYLSGKSLSRWHLPLLVVPLCLLSSSFRYHSFTGMETTLAFFSNAFLILSVIHYSRKPGNAAFVLLFFSAVFTFQVRSDNGIYSILFPMLYLLSLKIISLKKVFIYLIAFFAAAGLILLLNSYLFGSSLPVPFYAKSGDFYSGYAGRANWNAAGYLLRFMRDTAPFIGIVILFARKRKIPVLLSILVPVAATFVYYATTLQIMGWFARYYFPSIPFLVFAAFITAEDQLSKKFLLSPKYLPGRGAFLLVFLLPILYTPLRTGIEGLWIRSLSEAQLYTPETVYVTPSQEPLETIPWWASIQYMSSFVGNLPPRVKVAATEYGYIASENLHAIVVDMAGLHDKDLVLRGFSSGSILSRDPDIIWLPHTDYTLFRKMLLDDPIFRERYDYYPGVFNYGVALRLGSSSYREALTALDSVFSRAYPGRELADYCALPVK